MSPWFGCFCERDEGVPMWTRQSAHLGRGLRQPGQAIICNTDLLKDFFCNNDDDDDDDNRLLVIFSVDY